MSTIASMVNLLEARDTLRNLTEAKPEPQRKEGEVWKSGDRWYTKKNGHVQPTSAPGKTGYISQGEKRVNPKELAGLPDLDKALLKAGLAGPHELEQLTDEQKAAILKGELPPPAKQETPPARERRQPNQQERQAAYARDAEAWKFANLPKEYQDAINKERTEQRKKEWERIEIIAGRIASMQELKRNKRLAEKAAELEAGGDLDPDDPDAKAVYKLAAERIEAMDRSASKEEQAEAAHKAAVMGGATANEPSVSYDEEGRWHLSFSDGRLLTKAKNGVWRLKYPNRAVPLPLHRYEAQRYEDMLQALRKKYGGNMYNPDEGRKAYLTARMIARDYNYRLQRQGKVARATAIGTSNILAAIDTLAIGTLRRLGFGPSRVPWASILYAIGSNYKDPRKMAETAAGMIVDNSDKILQYADEKERESEVAYLKKKQEEEELKKHGRILEPWERPQPFEGVPTSSSLHAGMEDDKYHSLERKIKKLVARDMRHAAKLQALLHSKTEEPLAIAGLVDLLEAEEEEKVEELPTEAKRKEALLTKLVDSVASYDNDPLFGLLVVTIYTITRNLDSAIEGANYILQQQDEQEAIEALASTVTEAAHREGEPWQGKSGRWFVMKKGRPVPYKKEEGKATAKEEPPKRVGDSEASPPPLTPKEQPAQAEVSIPLGLQSAALNRRNAEGPLETGSLAALEKTEALRRQTGRSTEGPKLSHQLPVIPASFKKEGVRVYIVNSKFKGGPIGILPKFGPLHHRGVFFCPADQRPVIGGFSNAKCRGYGLQAGTSTFQPEANRVQATYREVELPAATVAQRIEGFRKQWTILHNCQVAANTVTEAVMEAVHPVLGYDHDESFRERMREPDEIKGAPWFAKADWHEERGHLHAAAHYRTVAKRDGMLGEYGVDTDTPPGSAHDIGTIHHIPPGNQQEYRNTARFHELGHARNALRRLGYGHYRIGYGRYEPLGDTLEAIKEDTSDAEFQLSLMRELLEGTVELIDEGTHFPGESWVSPTYGELTLLEAVHDPLHHDFNGNSWEAVPHAIDELFAHDLHEAPPDIHHDFLMERGYHPLTAARASKAAAVGKMHTDDALAKNNPPEAVKHITHKLAKSHVASMRRLEQFAGQQEKGLMRGALPPLRSSERAWIHPDLHKHIDFHEGVAEAINRGADQLRRLAELDEGYWVHRHCDLLDSHDERDRFLVRDRSLLRSDDHRSDCDSPERFRAGSSGQRLRYGQRPILRHGVQ